MSGTVATRREGRSISGIDYLESAPLVAQRLIGSILLVGGVGGVVVETEAYDQTEAASHAFRGPTARTAVLFGPPGHAYVYLSYGIHWCLNFVCREVGHGAGVLIRALQPTMGVAQMMTRRRQADPRLLCAGPGRLCQALMVTGDLNGRRIDRAPFRITSPRDQPEVVVGTRIGISKATAKRWRYGLKGSQYLSRPFR
jgi:DNA-3-methyladenine glycosylase